MPGRERVADDRAHHAACLGDDRDGMFVGGLGRTGPEPIVISRLQEHLDRCRRAPAQMFGEPRRRDEHEIGGVAVLDRRATPGG